MKALDKFKQSDTLKLTKSFYNFLYRLDYDLLYFNRANDTSFVLARANSPRNKVTSHLEFTIGGTVLRLPRDDLNSIELGLVLDRLEASDYRFIDSTSDEIIEVIFNETFT